MGHLNLRGKRNIISVERNCTPPEYRSKFPFSFLPLSIYHLDLDSDTVSGNTGQNKETKLLISGWKTGKKIPRKPENFRKSTVKRKIKKMITKCFT